MEGVLYFITYGANAVCPSIFIQHTGYTHIIFTPYSAEAHNALPLRSARRRGADVGDKRNEPLGLITRERMRL